MPDPQLELAYHQTDYRVSSPGGEFVIRIGKLCPEIDAEQWAFITACNPMSRLLSDQENAGRMQQLEAELAAANYRFEHGAGVGRDGQWPPEPSLLVYEIDEAAAIELARRYDQAAIVVGRRNEPARLVWVHG